MQGAQTSPRALETGHHAAQVHSWVATKEPMARTVAGVNIQGGTPRPPETYKKPRGLRAREGLTLLGPPAWGTAKGVAQVERPHPAAVVVPKVISTWNRCLMRTVISLRSPDGKELPTSRMSWMIPCMMTGLITEPTFIR